MAELGLETEQAGPRPPWAEPLYFLASRPDDPKDRTLGGTAKIRRQLCTPLGHWLERKVVQLLSWFPRSQESDGVPVGVTLRRYS